MLDTIYSRTAGWELCLERLQEKWGQDVDKGRVIYRFIRACKLWDLPYLTFNREKAFVKAEGSWRGELMLSAAERLIKRSVRVTGPVVRLSPVLQTLVIDRSCIATIDEDDEDPDRVVEECDCGGECHD